MITKNIILKIIQQFLQFVIGIIIAKALGTLGNGYFSLFIANASFVILLLGFSSESTITYFLAKNKISLNQVSFFSLTILIAQIILYFLIIGISHFILKQNLFELKAGVSGIGWAFLFIFSQIFGNYFIAILFAFKGFEKVAISNIIMQIAFLVILFFFHFKKVDVFSAETIIPLYTLLIFFVALANFLIIIFRFQKAIQPKYEKNIFQKEIIHYTVIVFLSNIIQFFCYRMDIWFINYYHTKSEIGIYSIATKIVQLWWILPQMFSSLLFPLTALNGISAKRFSQILRNLLLILILISIFAVFIYPLFIKIFLGIQYKESYYPFIYLLPGVILFSITILLASKFSGEGNAKINLKGSLICFIIILILDFLLIPKYGINGAAIASSIGYICSASYSFVSYKIIYGKTA